MASPKGRWVWYELMTKDLAAARDFYTKVVGWNATDAKMPDMDYWIFNSGEAQIAGLMTIPKAAADMGAPPSWMGYVAVDDVDAAAASVTASGGTLYHPPTDIPNVGRFSVIADPGGAAISLFKSANPEMDQPPAQDQPGRVGWHELYSSDATAAFDFYSKLFGWAKVDQMDMGPMGMYTIFGIGELQLGGMMNRPPEVPVSYWGYYFNVGNIDEATERVKAAGGQVLNGPMDVPGGGFIIQAMDPQGAAFALFGKR